MPPAGFVEGRMIAYWLSFDPDSRVLKYGMGHHMEETTLLTCPLPEGPVLPDRDLPKAGHPARLRQTGPPQIYL